MKIRIENKEKGLYRVVVAVSNRWSGCLSTDPDDCEARGNIHAVGFWYRHDDPDLEEKTWQDILSFVPSMVCAIEKLLCISPKRCP